MLRAISLGLCVVVLHGCSPIESTEPNNHTEQSNSSPFLWGIMGYMLGQSMSKPPERVVEQHYYHPTPKPQSPVPPVNKPSTQPHKPVVTPPKPTYSYKPSTPSRSYSYSSPSRSFSSSRR